MAVAIIFCARIFSLHSFQHHAIVSSKDRSRYRKVEHSSQNNHNAFRKFGTALPQTIKKASWIWYPLTVKISPHPKLPDLGRHLSLWMTKKENGQFNFSQDRKREKPIELRKIERQVLSLDMLSKFRLCLKRMTYTRRKLHR